jgi:hypothetical protein
MQDHLFIVLQKELNQSLENGNDDNDCSVVMAVMMMMMMMMMVMSFSSDYHYNWVLTWFLYLYLTQFRWDYNLPSKNFYHFHEQDALWHMIEAE